MCETIFVLIIEWKSGIPSIEEIRGIRLLDGELKDRSLTSVIAELKAKDCWEMEFYGKRKIEAAMQLCNELKLQYRIE